MDVTEVVPVEITLHIASFLTAPQDLSHFREVSKRWKGIVATDASVWRSMYNRVCRVTDPCTDHADWFAACCAQPTFYKTVFAAIEARDAPATLALLADPLIEINMRNADGHSYLHRVATQWIANNYPVPEQTVISFLADRGANMNIGDNLGLTPLHYAVTSDDLHLVELLVSKCADHLVTDNSGRSPYLIAKERSLSAILAFLARKTPTGLLCNAAKNGDLAQVKQLLAQGVSIEQDDQNGKTALHWAVERKDVKMAALLIDMGANIGAKNQRGQTPVHYAGYQGSLEILKLMIAKEGPEIINWHNDDNEMVFNYACNWGHLEMVEYMIQFDVNILNLDVRGSTPFHHACSSFNIPLISLLLEKYPKEALIALNTKNKLRSTPRDIAKDVAGSDVAGSHTQCLLKLLDDFMLAGN
eukprot:TRINITY_DN500_c1_g2_i1.p1 TRINITY_DN500_c1_g2~~TRINITY_DN500_c1_g2_i1.p1  ORF type:complete len:416 (-),score=38.82 TRINITY_DN500_c1_g2_i1:110-1357(-)